MVRFKPVRIVFSIAIVAVFIDFMFHKVYFEFNYQNLIANGYFKVEGLPYYGSKFLIIFGVSGLLWQFYKSEPFFPILNAFVSASAFSLLYYLVRPIGPFTDAYTGFLVAMYLTHFGATLVPSLAVSILESH